MNPSVDEILLAINKASAKNIFVLPNNSNIILAANQARELAKSSVYVVPTTNMPEGVSAALAFDPEAEPEDNLANMTEAFSSVDCLEITHAVRSTRMNGFSVKEGDIIGICGKKIIAKSANIDEAVLAAVNKVAQNKDMLTMYFGEDVTEEDAERLAGKIEEAHKDLEVAYYFGGQPHYYYIISVE